jgi:hypothetical protein
MNDSQLNAILSRAKIPGRREVYWDRFPAQVVAELDHRRQVPNPARVLEHRRAWSAATVLRLLAAKPAFAFGMAAACLLFVFWLGFWQGQHASAKDRELAAARRYFEEVAALFPHQLQAIVFDQAGAHLVLAQNANLPASPPLYLKISGPKGSQRFITFSGQQIQVNGEVCDVLADGQGKVLLVGRQLLWPGSDAGRRMGPYHIEARPLENRL